MLCKSIVPDFILKLVGSEPPEFETVFKLGEDLIMNEMNIFTLLETILKIKATLTVLIGDDKQILKKI